MAVYLNTPINITPSTSDWTTIDLSPYVSGATIAMLYVYNADVTNSNFITVRNADSSQNNYGYVYPNHSIVIYSTLNTNNQIAVRKVSVNISIYLMGYFQYEAEGLTDNKRYIPSASGNYEDVDLSATVPNDAVFGIFNMMYGIASGTPSFGMRKNGSSDDFYSTIGRSQGYICGLDSNKICEAKTSNASTNLLWLVGWINTGVAKNSALNKSLGSIDSYVDIDCSADSDYPSGATSVFVQFYRTAVGQHSGAIRDNGASVDLYNYVATNAGIRPSGITSGIFEGKINNTAMDFYVTGYAPAVTSPIIESESTNSDSSDCSSLGINKVAKFEDKLVNQQIDEIVSNQFHRNNKVKITFPTSGVTGRVKVGFRANRFTIIDRSANMRVWEAPNPPDDNYLYLKSNGTGSVTLMVWKQGG